MSTFYVAKTGNNNNLGTQDQPWLTIGKAVSTVSAGDIVYIRAGTYSEHVIIARSGTAGALIKFLAYPGETPIIDGSSVTLATWDSLVQLQGNYISLIGVEVCNSAWMGIEMTGQHNTVDGCYSHQNNEQAIIGKGDYSVIQNCRAWRNALHNFQGAQRTGGWAAAIVCARDNVDDLTQYAVMRNNVSWENWGEGINTHEADHTLVEGNISYDNYATNYYISDATNVTLQCNFGYNTPNNTYISNGSGDYYGGSGIGIEMGDELHTPPSSGNTVINNIIYSCRINLFWWANGGSDGLINCLIANNTFVNSTVAPCIEIDSGAHSNTRFLNNLTVQEGSLSIASFASSSGITKRHNGWSKTAPSGARGTGDVTGTPQLAKTGTAYAPAWYQLKSTSPDLNHAEVVVEVTVDYLGNPRSATPEIGALESVLLIVSSISQIQTVDNVTLTAHSPNYSLVIQNAAQAQVIDNLVLTVHLPDVVHLIIQDAAQVNTIENVDLIQHNKLIIADVSQAQTIEMLSLIQHNVLVIADVVQTQTIENVTVIPHYMLEIQDVAQGQTVDNVTLVPYYWLVIADVVQVRVIDEIDLIQHNQLVIADMAQPSELEPLTLVAHEPDIIRLVIQDIIQTQHVDFLNLISHPHYQLTIADVQQHQVVDNLTLVPYSISGEANGKVTKTEALVSRLAGRDALQGGVVLQDILSPVNTIGVLALLLGAVTPSEVKWGSVVAKDEDYG